MDVMIDLETLSTRSDAVVLTIGMIKFDPYDISKEPDNGDYMRVDVDSQIELGRHVDNGTLDWWSKQDAEVRDEALGEDGRVSLDELSTRLNRFIVGATNIWAQGPVFDIVILEHLYRQLGKPAPWQYYQIRDSRTLFGLGIDPRLPGREAAHNALADCYYQAKGVQEVYNRLGIKKD